LNRLETLPYILPSSEVRMHCQVRSADRTLFDGEATMVVARSASGEFAVMDGHAPLLASLRSGPLRVKTSEGARVFACFGGSLRVSDGGEVTVLVEDAVPLEEIDLTALEGGERDAPRDETDVEAGERRAVLRRVKEAYG
jgi:F-type H+-transporting ATPase subunit epsilon